MSYEVITPSAARAIFEDVYWRLIKDGEELQPPIAETQDLGTMLYDMDFSDHKKAIPKFFRAKTINGIITIR